MHLRCIYLGYMVYLSIYLGYMVNISVMHVSMMCVSMSYACIYDHDACIYEAIIYDRGLLGNERTTIMIIILIITIAMIGMILGEINIRQSIKRQFHETAYLSIYQLLHSLVLIIFIVNIINSLVNW